MQLLCLILSVVVAYLPRTKAASLVAGNQVSLATNDCNSLLIA